MHRVSMDFGEVPPPLFDFFRRDENCLDIRWGLFNNLSAFWRLIVASPPCLKFHVFFRGRVCLPKFKQVAADKLISNVTVTGSALRTGAASGLNM